MGNPTFKPRYTARAKALRNAATPAERKLWQFLANRQLGGHKFSRQMPIGPYVADFLCRDRKLIVELDGYSHDLRIAQDRARTDWLNREGYRVIRFSNADVAQGLEGVLLMIGAALTEGREAHPRPSRTREGSE